MEFRTPEGSSRYDALVERAAHTLVALDFDGVLSPIVPDPTAAVIHPDGPATLAALLPHVAGVAVVTGRPARQALELGRLEEVADRAGAPGRAAELHVLGQYGNERWSAHTREVVSPPPPDGLAGLVEELPDLLAAGDAAGAFVEDKGLAVAIHTRRLSDPGEAFDRLLPLLTDAAERHDLDVEPGRLVVEIRGRGMHKGQALRTIADELEVAGVLYAGDDLGDVAAFREVSRLRERGTAGLLVCSGSDEQRALVELADVVVDGPAGVLRLLGEFTRAVRERGAT
jgi:trehalose 6-phosphate phosphatase